MIDSKHSSKRDPAIDRNGPNLLGKKRISKTSHQTEYKVTSVSYVRSSSIAVWMWNMARPQCIWHVGHSEYPPIRCFYALTLCALQIVFTIFLRHHTPINTKVRHISGCQPLSYTVTDRRKRLFGHVVHSSPDEDHHRSVAAAIQKPYMTGNGR